MRNLKKELLLAAHNLIAHPLMGLLHFLGVLLGSVGTALDWLAMLAIATGNWIHAIIAPQNINDEH
jgi:hypothetical protein